jgi:uncharacterized membrane protein YfcA
MNYLFIGLVGMASGVIAGLFGVGGGIVMVPALIYLLNFDTKMAIGTSLAVIVPTALMGASKHYLIGNVNWKVALILVPVAVLGAWLGAKLTVPISSEHLKRAFGGFLICVGVYTAFFK